MSNIAISFALPDSTGGANVALAYGLALQEQGHRVFMLHGDVDKMDDKERRIAGSTRFQQAGFEVVTVPGLEFPLGAKPLETLKDKLRQVGAAAAVSFHVRDASIIAQAASELRIPGVVVAQCTRVFRGNWLVRKYKERVFGGGIRRYASFVICVSDAVRKEMIERFKVPAEKVITIDNGIDVSRFHRFDASDPKRTALRAELGVNDQSLLLLCVGRLVTQKAQDLLLQAIANAASMVPDIDFRVAICGAYDRDVDPSFKDGLQRLLNLPEVSKRVALLGERRDIPELLASSDALVHCSRWEGFPLVVLEAMASELPCIMSDCSGVPSELRPGEDVLVCRAGDVQSLTEALVRLLVSSPEQRQSMAVAGKRYTLEHRNLSMAKERFVSTLTSLIDSHSRYDPKRVNTPQTVAT